MKYSVYKTIIAVVATGIIFGCKPNLKAPDPEKGSIDATKYVAIGNSITSGYADGALYYEGQQVSFPNLLAEQLKEIGGGEFKQPLFPVGSVGAAPVGTVAVNAKLILGYKTDCNGLTGLSPIPAAASGDAASLFTSVSAQGPFNNMGVPGAKAIHVSIPGYGIFNPFFGRMASNKSTASILSDAVAQNATFFSLFIGNNDVLGYATSGGVGDVITPQANFDASIDAVVNAMTANGAKGVIGNIPDVTSIPFCTTIPYNGLILDAATAAQLTGYYALSFPSSGVTFNEGVNPFVIQDADAPGGVRKMKSNELLLLTTPQDSLKCAKWGSLKAIASQYVLTETEIANIQSATAGFNAKLRSVADAKDLAFVDVNAFMAQTKKGMTYNGVTLSATFVSGGAFSLDGVHLTPRGNALLANEFIKAINSKYGSTIRQVDVTKYNGVVFP
ncbi:MAG: hypothetical protein JNL60_03400 [Bacteroidia bacterium]|nr:hypothetical protein [Bacteroidia bacterium]